MNSIISRLLKYIHTCFDVKPSPVDDLSITPCYERSFNRFPIEFEVIVASIDKTGKEYREMSMLHDISGSGAMFTTFTPERYFTGQQLKLDIFLAGTDAVRASVKTEAEVVRMQMLGAPCGGSDLEPERGNGKVGVAVKFSLPFEFQRTGNLR